MSDSSLRAGQGGLTQEWLESYIAHRRSIHKTTSKIEDELIELGLDGETAGTMVRNAENSQWLAEGGGGPALGRVGPAHMITGTLLMAGCAALTTGLITSRSISRCLCFTYFTGQSSPARPISSTAS